MIRLATIAAFALTPFAASAGTTETVCKIMGQDGRCECSITRHMVGDRLGYISGQCPAEYRREGTSFTPRTPDTPDGGGDGEDCGPKKEPDRQTDPEGWQGWKDRQSHGDKDHSKGREGGGKGKK